MGTKRHARFCSRRRHSRYPAAEYQRLRSAEGGLSQSRLVWRHHPKRCLDLGAPRSLFAQVKFLTLFALLFGAGLQLLLKRGTRWIQSRLTLLVILGFIHGLFFWDGDILLAYGLVGLICWRLIRDAHSGKGLFNTGVMLYLMGLCVLLLLGLISGDATNRSWIPDAANLQYEQLLEAERRYGSDKQPRGYAVRQSAGAGGAIRLATGRA